MPTLLVVAALLLQAAATQIPETVDATAIPKYLLLKPGLATAGQPTPDALRALKQQGFRTVINLRAETEPGVKEEEALVKAEGLRYVSVPITPAGLTQQQVDQVAKALDDPEAGPILLHCGSANRVGAVWTAIQVQKGRSYEEALAEARKIGLTSPALVEAVNKLLGRESK
jgi:uncharacterized protein (TIGR01244 family)